MTNSGMRLKEKKETAYNFSINYRGEDHSEVYSMPKIHYHSNYEIHYLIEGERSLLLNNTFQHFNKGQLLFIRCNDMHRLMSRNNTSHQRYMLEFKRGYLEALVSAAGMMDIDELLELSSQVISLNDQEQKRVVGLMASIHLLREKCDKATHVNGLVKNDEGLIKFKLIELLSVIYQVTRPEIDRQVSLGARTSQLKRGKTLHNKLPSMIAYTHKNYRKHLTVDVICQEFYISKSYFCLIFKEMTGLSFIQYLNEVRIKEAVNLIKLNDQKISEIAYAVGYKSSTHFGRVFKSIIGETPSNYKHHLL